MTGVRDTCKWLVLATLLVVLDQLTKYLAVQGIPAGSSIPLLPSLSLVLTYNTGAAFSFLAGASGWQRWFFVLIALAASALIIWMLHRHRRETFLCFGLALILGGAIGNLIDRMLVGAVVDSWCTGASTSGRRSMLPIRALRSVPGYLYGTA